MDKITTPAKIKEHIQKSSFYFKKNLGQNFLKDEAVARKITDLVEANENDCVLEIGPGFGSLTQFLVSNAKEVIAVEIDPFAVKVLNEVFEGVENLKIVNADILKTDIDELLAEAKHAGFTLKVISNLPYYITSPILMKLLSGKTQFENIVVMLQKEVAARLAAKPSSKDYSSFTIAVDYYAEAEKCFDVSKNVFMPSPNVDSSVLKLTPRKTPKIEVINEEIFFKTVKAAFAMRRKTMLNCISSGFSLDKEKTALLLNKADIEPSIRGEKLTMQEFGRLADILKTEIE